MGYTGHVRTHHHLAHSLCNTRRHSGSACACWCLMCACWSTAAAVASVALLLSWFEPQAHLTPSTVLGVVFWIVLVFALVECSRYNQRTLVFPWMPLRLSWWQDEPF